MRPVGPRPRGLIIIMEMIETRSAVDLLYGKKDCRRNQMWRPNQVLNASLALGRGTLSLIDAIDFFLSLPEHNHQSFDLALQINQILLDEGRGGAGRAHLKEVRSSGGQSRYLIDADCYYLPRK